MAVAVRWFSPGPKIYWRGRWFDKAMVVALTDLERSQGFKEYFYQGSYNRGVRASGGTHDLGAVCDKQSKGTTDRQRAARRGLVFWPRTRGQGFSPHDHGMLMWANTGSRGLKAQMYSWRNGRNGLAGNGKDNSGVRAHYRHYLDWRKTINKVKPNVYVDGVNKSRRYGNKVRPYASVRLMQKALNDIYGGSDLQVDGVLGPKTLKRFNGFRSTHFPSHHARGSIGATSLKLLFRRANMRVNVWNRLKDQGGRIQ